jgi:predicted dehydrogenase/threonine dehydrogenase-like Zn-dependent dehydrogenase
MRQVLQARRTGLTVVRSVPQPTCPPGGVLVRTAVSAISSGTERARTQLSQKSLVGKARDRPDLVREVFSRARSLGMRSTVQAVAHRLNEEASVGYSSAGTVIEVGEHARDLRPGELVACAGATANHAEVVAVPSNLCARVPPGVPLECAAITTIASVALHGIRLADVRVGSRAAVIGCGLVGQIALRLLRAAGAETFALDIDPRRVEQLGQGAADHTFVITASTAEEVREAAGGVGVDEVLVAAAAVANHPLLLAAEIARDRGEIVLIGAVPIELPRGPLYEKELRFRVSRSYGPGRYDAEYEERGLDYPIGYIRWTQRRNMQEVLRLQAQELVSFADLIEVIPVARASEAYARLADATQAPLRGAIVLAYGPMTAPSNGDRGADQGASATRPDAEHVTAPARTKRGIGSSPVRIGLIGPGGFAGRVVIPALKSAGASLIVVGGGAGPSASMTARAGPFRRIAADEAAVIADPDVDAVVICTRHANHAKLVRSALSAGKHVFCEKPLALTADEQQAVMTAAEGASGILMVGFNRRFSPLLEAARAFLGAGRLPMTITYRVSAGPLAEDHWLHDLAQGGGRAIGEGCHFVDSVSFLTSSRITEVQAMGQGPPSRPLQAHDNFVVTLRCDDLSLATVVYTAAGSPAVPKERVEAFCGTRSAILDDYRGLELFDGRRHDKRRLRSQDKGHRQELAAFVHAAQTGRPAMSLSHIGNVSLASLAIVESMRTGASVRLPCSPGPA